MTVKHFHGKKLSTTDETIITTAEKQDIVNEAPEKPKNIICCPDILNVIVNIYPICNNKDCRKNVAANPGSRILRCHGCNRSMLLKNCYIEVNASFQLEKENTHENQYQFVVRVPVLINNPLSCHAIQETSHELMFQLLYQYSI